MMLSRLLLGAALVSCTYLLLAQTSRNACVKRVYHFPDAERGFEAISRIISQEFSEFGVESACSMRGNVAHVSLTRRAHAELLDVIGGTRGATPMMPVL